MKRKLLLVDLNKQNADIASIWKFNLSFCKDWLFNKVIYFDSLTSQTKSNTNRTYSLWRKSHLQICFIPHKLTFIPLSLFLVINYVVCATYWWTQAKAHCWAPGKMLPLKFARVFKEPPGEISKVAETKVRLEVKSHIVSL